MSTTSIESICEPTSTAWQPAFIAMMPSIESHAMRAFRGFQPEARQEATQAVVAAAATAYARLVDAGKGHLGFASTLARFAVKQYRAGRLDGASVNSLDVGSRRWCMRGCGIESLDQWGDQLTESRRSTPADIAALRIDFTEWYGALSRRDQDVVKALAQGERVGCVAKLCQLTAGRVSQIRGELYANWLEFTAEAATSTAQY